MKEKGKKKKAAARRAGKQCREGGRGETGKTKLGGFKEKIKNERRRDEESRKLNRC